MGLKVCVCGGGGGGGRRHKHINAPRFLRQWTVEVVVFEILPVPLSVFMFYRAFRRAIHD